MSYVPNPVSDHEAMLAAMGCSNMDSLFADIPAEVKLNRPLNLQPSASELEIQNHLKELANKNISLESHPAFMGGGAYRHFTPALVDQLLLRSEFYTAYTPYQPEISQGILQAIFEWQTYICLLTGMDVANASMYDGASALAEACLMSAAITRRSKVVLPDNLNPAYIKVVRTYLHGKKVEVIILPTENGVISPEQLESLNDTTAAVVIQYPNYYGLLEPHIETTASAIHAAGGLLIMSADPIALGMLKTPANWGADLVVGDGQPLGLPLNYGGPYVGYLAAREKYTRFIPGRLVGQTVDSRGDVGYVLTLQAREQHIRRDKAGSNICSNEALCALAATIYLASVGREGLVAVARRCHQLALYARNQLQKAGFSLLFQAPFFSEFAVKVNEPREINQRLWQEGIIGGIELEQGLLFAFTEQTTCEQIDRLAAVMGGK